MMTLSYPFRLTPNGKIALVEQGSLDHDVELVAVLIGTRKGERELVPDFGMTDPTFAELDEAELTNGLKTFGPDVKATITSVTARTETTVAYTIDVERA